MNDALKEVLGIGSNVVNFLKQKGKDFLEGLAGGVQQAAQRAVQNSAPVQIAAAIPKINDLISNVKQQAQIALPRIGGEVQTAARNVGSTVNRFMQTPIQVPQPISQGLFNLGIGQQQGQIAIRPGSTAASVVNSAPYRFLKTIGYDIPSGAGKNIADLIISAKNQVQSGQPSTLPIVNWKVPAAVAVPGKLAIAGLNLTPLGVASTYAAELAKKGTEQIPGAKGTFLPETVGLVAGLLTPGGEGQDAQRAARMAKLAEEAGTFKSFAKWSKALEEAAPASKNFATKLDEASAFLSRAGFQGTLKDFYSALRKGTPVEELVAKAKESAAPLVSATEKLNQSTDEIVNSIKKERGFVKTVKEAPTTAEEVAAKVQGTYSPITNPETYARGQFKISTEGFDTAWNRVIKEPLSAETNTMGQELIRMAQAQGRYQEAANLAETLAKKGTEAGQGIQAFSIWSRLTPEGMLKYAAQEIEKGKQKWGSEFATRLTGKLFGKAAPELTAEDSALITQVMQKAQSATDPLEQAKYARQALEVINDKVPWGVNEVLDTFRYNNMLSNPLSHLRNVWSNTIQSFITRPATLTLEGRPVEAAKYEVAALKSIPEAFSAFARSFRSGEAVDLAKLDVGTVRSAKVPLAISWPTRAMEAADQFFQTIIKGGEMARGKTAEEATKAGQYFLFRNEMNPAGQGYLLQGMDKILAGLYQLRKAPGVGYFIPFLKTPFNVAKQMLEYSPAGLATIPGAAAKREQLAKTLLGSIVTAFGAKAAAEGRTTWSAPTDPEEKSLFYATGRKPYSVLIGGNWIPMQTFGVFQWAIGLPAAYQYYNSQSPTALTDSQTEKLANTAFSLISQWSQSTPMAGLGGFVRTLEGDVDYNVIRSLAQASSSLIPDTGMLRYLAQVVDPIYRKPQGFVQQLETGIPVLSKLIPNFYTEPSGEPSTRNIFSYFTPYGVGIPKPAYEPMFQERVGERQTNAVLKELKSGGTINTPGVGTVKAAGLEGDLTKISGSTGISDVVKEQEKYKKVNSYMDLYYKTNDPKVQSQIEQTVSKYGVNMEDAKYNYVSGLTANEKTSWLTNQMKAGSLDHAGLIRVLSEGRKEGLGGNKFAADGVVDDMLDAGYLSKAEATALKKLKLNKAGQQISGGGTGLSKSQYSKALTLLKNASASLAKDFGNPPKSGSLEQLLKPSQPTAKQVKIPTAEVNVGFSTPKIEAPSVDTLIAKTKATTGTSEEEIKRILASLRAARGSISGSPNKLSQSFFRVA